jgi:hypothetical protein
VIAPFCAAAGNADNVTMIPIRVRTFIADISDDLMLGKEMQAFGGSTTTIVLPRVRHT